MYFYVDPTLSVQQEHTKEESERDFRHEENNIVIFVFLNFFAYRKIKIEFLSEIGKELHLPRIRSGS